MEMSSLSDIEGAQKLSERVSALPQCQFIKYQSSLMQWS